jgi:epsilon-lactone hydrolase
VTVSRPSVADPAGDARAQAAYAAVFGPEHHRSVRALRERFDSLLASMLQPQDALAVPVDAGGVPALLVADAEADPASVIVWFHSGGYVLGTAAGYRSFASSLSAACGRPVLLPDYRRAPEHPFPAPVEDAQRALAWAMDRHGAAGTLVGGDSAGGALALAALVDRRDAGRSLPAATALVSPLLDLTLGSASLSDNAAHDIAVTLQGMQDIVAAYLQGADPADPRASPLLAELTGLPPTIVLASGDEALRDDARRVVRALDDAELLEYTGVVHAWPLFASFLPAGREAFADVAAFFSRVAGEA